MIWTAIVALLALAALAVVVRGAVLSRAGRAGEGTRWMLLGAALLMATTAVLLLAQQG